MDHHLCRYFFLIYIFQFIEKCPIPHIKAHLFGISEAFFKGAETSIAFSLRSRGVETGKNNKHTTYQYQAAVFCLYQITTYIKYQIHQSITYRKKVMLIIEA